MSKPTNPGRELLHYFLVVAEIVFQLKEVETPSAVRVNAVLTSQDGRISVAAIGRAQQAVQIQFHQKVEDNGEVQVLDVVILGLLPLGIFTAEQFNAKPPGVDVREKVRSETRTPFDA